MKRMLMLGMTLSVLAIPSLCAAFLDLKGEVPPPPHSCCWTGIYLGGNLGGKWGNFRESARVDVSSLGILLSPAESVSFNNREASIIGGAQIGYNWQINNMLLGIETDLDAQDLGSTEKLGQTALGTVNFSPEDSFRTRSNWQTSLRARVGYVRENWLLYLTGGLALTDIQLKGNFVQVNTGTLIFPATSGTSSRLFLGGTVGIGTEYAFWNHWSVGGEYRFTSYQTKSVHLSTLPTLGANTFAGPIFVYTPVTARIRLYTNEVLFKLNYNFG